MMVLTENTDIDTNAAAGTFAGDEYEYCRRYTTALKQDASRAVAVAVVAMDTNADCLMDRF
jgi:hypothetical protein